VLNVLDATRLNPLAYSPYGHRPAESGLLSLLGFNGERPDPVTGWYLLGNGYRAFNPVLMRFNSPDSWSPFGEGGVNGYAYCAGDPVNRQDSTGHIPLFPKGYNPFKGFGNRLGLRTPARQSLLPGRESTSSGSNASFATEVARAQEKDQIIASQRSTIESQQKTIAFQQKNLDSAQSTIELGKAVVRDYKSALTQQEALIFKLRTKISELQTDLEFSVHTNPNSDRTTADIATAYGSHSPPQPRSGVLPNHIPHNNTTIRSM
jgi:RHS repeat-associated protein